MITIIKEKEVMAVKQEEQKYRSRTDGLKDQDGLNLNFTMRRRMEEQDYIQDDALRKGDNFGEEDRKVHCPEGAHLRQEFRPLTLFNTGGAIWPGERHISIFGPFMVKTERWAICPPPLYSGLSKAAL